MVADFGLARNMYDSDYYQKKHDRPRPIRWMAPESILRDIYSCKSDVVGFIHLSSMVQEVSLLLLGCQRIFWIKG